MNKLRHYLKNIAKRILPERIYKAILILFQKEISFNQQVARLRKISINRNKFKDIESELSELRYHAHIIDKGLHRVDWEKGRSVKHYEAAKNIISKYDGIDDPSFKWAKYIVNQYEKMQKSGCTESSSYSSNLEEYYIDNKSLYEFLKLRTSCRLFKEKPIGKEDVILIVKSALEAPSSSNRQTLKVYASINPKTAREAAKVFPGFTGFSHFLPAFFIFCADTRSYALDQELFRPSIDTALATQNAMLMATSLGMSMTPLVWRGHKNEESSLRKLWNIPKWEQIVMGATCGFPKINTFKPARKSVNKTVFFR